MCGRRRRQIFIPGQLAVVILIQRQQLSGRVGDLVRINDTIVIHVQRREQRRRGRAMPLQTLRSAGIAWPWPSD